MKDLRILRMSLQKSFQSYRKVQDMETCLQLDFCSEARTLLENLLFNLDINLTSNQMMIKARLSHLFKIIEINYLDIAVLY
jgi:hypothetical protein